MQPSWMGWLGFLVLAALITVSSCQVLTRSDAAPANAEASG